MDDEIRKAQKAFSKIQQLQAQLDEAGLGHLELASAGNLVTIAGVVRSAEARDRAVALARAAGFMPHDAITIDDPSDTDELAVMARKARSSRDPFPILKEAIARADHRNDPSWRIRLRLQLEEALRGPLRYAEAVQVCREAVAIEENAETLYALAYCLHEGGVGFVKAAPGEVEGLYERVLAMTAESSKLHEQAKRMLDGYRRVKK
jgi:tetratricopeptide (TPR) repeat protein